MAERKKRAISADDATVRKPAAGKAASAAFRSPVGCTNSTSGEQEFVSWCQEERIRFPSSRIAVTATTGRALVASRNIKMGEVVVEVPDDAVLMADNCSINEVLEEEGLTKPADDEVLEVQGLIIAVMFEKWRGSESRWAPYLALLPDDMSHMPLYWKRGEFRELRGTAAYDKMMGQVQHPADAPTQVPLLWSEVVAPFIQEHPDLGLPSDQHGYELYRWATCAVASYSFILGDDKYQAMVPVWDLLNHVTGAVNVRLHHCAKRHVLKMIATRDISGGEELVNNYGELSNAELLRGYGFVEATNVNNHVQVPLGFVVRAAREVLELGSESKPGTEANGAAAEAEEEEEAVGPGPGSARQQAEESASRRNGVELTPRLRQCRRLGLLPQHHIFKVYADQPPPAAMTALIHLLLGSASQATELQDAGRRAVAAAAALEAGGGRKGKADGKSKGCGAVGAAAAVSAVAGMLAEDGEAAARVVRMYEHIVTRMLGRYICSLKDDEKLMRGFDGLTPRLRAAVLARKPEKEALLALRAAVQSPQGLRRSLAAGLDARKPAVLSNGAGKAGEEKGNGAEVVGGRSKAGKAGGDSAAVQRYRADDTFAFGFSLQ